MQLRDSLNNLFRYVSQTRDCDEVFAWSGANCTLKVLIVLRCYFLMLCFTFMFSSGGLRETEFSKGFLE